MTYEGFETFFHNTWVYFIKAQFYLSTSFYWLLIHFGMQLFLLNPIHNSTVFNTNVWKFWYHFNITNQIRIMPFYRCTHGINTKLRTASFHKGVERHFITIHTLKPAKINTQRKTVAQNRQCTINHEYFDIERSSFIRT